ncbi:MAG TPA: STAS/SEC14 domain-containing protein [Reyranella sp.]|nr:STAS/SEC14 domain-containing protein [Reyranella sp.]
MALYWTIDSRRRTVDVVADGEVSMTDAVAFFDAVEGANALAYSKLLDGTRLRAAMTPDDVLSIIVRIRGLHALRTMGALAVVATAEQAERIARLLGAAAVADRPMKVFDDVRQARRWIEAQPSRSP